MLISTYSIPHLSRSSIGCYISCYSAACRLFPLFACLLGASVSNARLLLSTQHGRPRATRLTQAKAIAADTSRRLLLRKRLPQDTVDCLPSTSVCSVPSHTTTLQHMFCSTCQHMSASLSTPCSMPSLQPNTQSDPPASLRGCSKCTDGGVAEMAGPRR